METKDQNTVSIRMTGDAETALNLFIGNIREKVLRSATYAGAKVLYDEMRQRTQNATPDLYGQVTGQLKDAIYHWHDDKQSGLNKQVYAVGVNKKKAPHWHLIEYGHWQIYSTYKGQDGKFYTLKVNGNPVMSQNPKRVPAYPYIRPTFDAMGKSALEAAKKRMSERLKEF